MYRLYQLVAVTATLLLTLCFILLSACLCLVLSDTDSQWYLLYILALGLLNGYWHFFATKMPLIMLWSAPARTWKTLVWLLLSADLCTGQWRGIALFPGHIILPLYKLVFLCAIVSSGPDKCHLFSSFTRSAHMITHVKCWCYDITGIMMTRMEYWEYTVEIHEL